jgi:pimeloyl-ACP methyl ester carboxylesterase
VGSTIAPSRASAALGYSGRDIPWRLRITVGLAAAAVFTGTPAAFGALQFEPCGQPEGITCATVVVPLDRSGAVPGSVSIVVERKPATGGTSTGALVALTGGPGESGTAVTLAHARRLMPALVNRDLYAIDYRGVGLSGALSCPSAPDWEACAAELGPARHLYSTRDLVEDLESVRQAIGIDRIALAGFSYGTKVAQGYALRFGDHVELLILDSVVPVDGVDALARSSYRAIGRVLREICARGECRGVTRDPVADLAKLAARVARKPITVSYVRANGRIATAEVDVQTLFRVYESDVAIFDRGTRRRWPGAVRAALRGDVFPLGRLYAVTEIFVDSDRPARSTHGPTRFNPVAWRATRCEDLAAPWRGAGSLEERVQRLLDAIAALPARTFRPFPADLVRRNPDIVNCIHWPILDVQPLVERAATFTGPALVLAGREDVRTPLEDAQAAAHLFPGSSLVAVPDAGHVPLADVFAPCAARALADLVADARVRQCGAVEPRVPVFPVPPLAVAEVAPWRGVGGELGRKLGAVMATVRDIRASINSGLLVGLRGGTFRLSQTTARLRRIVYVPGVFVSGVVRFDRVDAGADTGSITVAGSIRGRLTIGKERITGQLDGQRVDAPRRPGVA